MGERDTVESSTCHFTFETSAGIASVIGRKHVFLFSMRLRELENAGMKPVRNDTSHDPIVVPPVEGSEACDSAWFEHRRTLCEKGVGVFDMLEHGICEKEVDASFLDECVPCSLRVG